MFDGLSYSENQNEYTLYRNQVRIILTNLIDNTGLLEIFMFFTINFHPYVSYIFSINFQSVLYIHIRVGVFERISNFLEIYTYIHFWLPLYILEYSRFDCTPLTSLKK